MVDHVMAELHLRSRPGLTGRVATKELALRDSGEWLKAEGLERTNFSGRPRR
jgi:hypothetical protein